MLGGRLNDRLPYRWRQPWAELGAHCSTFADISALPALLLSFTFTDILTDLYRNAKSDSYKHGHFLVDKLSDVNCYADQLNYLNGKRYAVSIFHINWNALY